MPGAEPPAGRGPDTIAAIAMPPGRGAIGIVRVSGVRAPEIARRLIGRLPEPRVATFAAARDATGQPLDEGLALYFPEPRSYTGEHCLEFQGHGGPVVLHAVLGAVLGPMFGGVADLVGIRASFATVGVVVLAFAFLATLGRSEPPEPLTAAGLAEAFAAALPFYAPTLAGDLFYTALLFGGFALAQRALPALREPAPAAA